MEISISPGCDRFSNAIGYQHLENGDLTRLRKCVNQSLNIRYFWWDLVIFVVSSVVGVELLAFDTRSHPGGTFSSRFYGRVLKERRSTIGSYP